MSVETHSGGDESASRVAGPQGGSPVGQVVDAVSLEVQEQIWVQLGKALLLYGGKGLSAGWSMLEPPRLGEKGHQAVHGRLLPIPTWSDLKVKVLAFQSCLTLCHPMDCSPPGSSIYRLFQANILEWVAIPFSRGSSWPRDWTQVSWIAGSLDGKKAILCFVLTV